ncbi:expressed unknown protein [Seminavis robusta]|uniref:Uncharacterized protein n=1 Tax=Seminavis robusta TaxID=568900 RepID=A0A9N8EY38_9STRA|nr:expressed unknown protein [Seminavis robusta]|eukprot:Sro2488_g329090.1 n/a (274) ;mRNA; f:12231-13052
MMMKSPSLAALMLATMALALLENATAFLPMPFRSRSSSSPMVQFIPFEAPTPNLVATTSLSAKKKRKKKKKVATSERSPPEFEITYKFGNGPSTTATLERPQTVETPTTVQPEEEEQPELVKALGDATDGMDAEAVAEAKAASLTARANEVARGRAEEEEREKAEEEEARIQAEEDEAARIKAEEDEATRIKAEEEASAIKAEQEEAARRKRIEEEAVGAFRGLPYHIIEARKQPKSPLQGAKLKDKYASIEDLGERAFAILVDLYMIELHED